MRGVLTSAAAALALLLPAAATGWAGNYTHGPILGVVPHAGGPRAPSALAPSSPSDLVYHGGSVMHASTTYAIYWFPNGYPLDASYENTINQYFADVAAASGSTSNVYSAGTQYYDGAGPISYISSFGGFIVDTHPFPPSGCDDSYKGSKDPVCLTDQQLQAEIQSVLTANGWHGGQGNIFFLMTPNGVGSCADSTPPNSGGECSTNTFCAYHSDFVNASSEDVIYADEPFEGSPGSGCTGPSQGFPNNQNADTTINTISHEHNEAITDSQGDAWYAPDGEENGDLCAYDFGTALGGKPGVDAYNQVIDGHRYDLQQEYSNDGSTCVLHYLGIPVNFGAPIVSGAARQGQILSATQGAWSQSPTSYTYQWLRCSSTSETSCFPFPGDTGQTYQLTAADVGKIFRVAVTATNAAGSSILAESASTAAVLGIPQFTSKPVVSGTSAVGKTLSTTTGIWNTSVSVGYQWLRCAANGTGCAAIPAAAASSYPLVAADAGHRLEAVVTATNAAGTGSASSAVTAVIVAVPAATGAPRIAGKVRVGKRLSGNHGNWAWSPTTYRYQWLRCSGRGGKCVAIKKATHTTYRVAKRDAGHRLRLRVTATNGAGARSATSRPTARVPALRHG
jgi:hypothetical protein